VSHALVSRTLDDMGYNLQSNRKVQEGGEHIDRDAQFNFINDKVKAFQAKKHPVISVDTKKKENYNGLIYQDKFFTNFVSLFICFFYAAFCK